MPRVTVRLPGLPSPATKHRRATIRSTDGRLNMTVPFAEREVDIEGIGQEWATIERFPNRPVTQRRGPKLARATFRMRCIARDPQSSIEFQLNAVHAVANSVSPVLISYGQSMTKRSHTGAWVIEDASIHVLQHVQGSNDARWAEVTLQLLEYSDWLERRFGLVDADYMPPQPPRTTAAGQRTPSTYTWRAGDTLYAVAQTIYGDASRWRAIGDANGVRDPGSLIAGDVLVLP